MNINNSAQNALQRGDFPKYNHAARIRASSTSPSNPLVLGLYTTGLIHSTNSTSSIEDVNIEAEERLSIEMEVMDLSASSMQSATDQRAFQSETPLSSELDEMELEKKADRVDPNLRENIHKSKEKKHNKKRKNKKDKRKASPHRSFRKNESSSFTNWLYSLEPLKGATAGQYSFDNDIKKQKSKKKKKKKKKLSKVEISAIESITLKSSIASETLAKVYESQELWIEAIEIYEKLRHTSPSESNRYKEKIAFLRKKLNP